MNELPIPIEALEDCGVVLGRRGAGKSNALMTLFEHELDAGHRTGMVDPKGDRWGVRFNPDGSSSRHDIVIFGGAHGDIAIADDMGEQVAMLIATRSFNFLIDLSEMHLAAQQRFMLDFSKALYHYNRDAITLFLEEIDQFANQDQRYQPPKLVHHISNLSSLGRQRGIVVWMASQRAAKVNKNLLNMIDTFIGMGARAPLDIATYVDWFKAHSPDAAKEVAAQVGKFGPGEAFVWVGATGYFEKMQFPMATTFDSGRRPKHGEKAIAITPLKADLGDLKEALAKVGLEPAADVSDAETAKLVQVKDEEIRALRAQLAGTQNNCEKLVRDSEAWQRRVAQLTRFNEQLVRQSDQVSEKVRALYEFFTSRVLNEIPSGATPGDGEAATAPVASSDAQPVSPPLARVERPFVVGEIDFFLPPRHAKILESILWVQIYLQKDMAARNLVAFKCERSAKSSGYANDLGALRTAGLIDYPQTGMLTLTADGRAMVPAWGKAPSSAEMQEVICKQLPERQSMILRTLIGMWPDSVPRETMAGTLCRSPKSSGWANDLGFLHNTMGVIEYPSQGALKAADFLCGR